MADDAASSGRMASTFSNAAIARGKIARAPGGKPGLVAFYPIERTAELAGHSQQFVDLQAARAAIDREPVEFANDDAIARQPARFGTDDDRGAVSLVGALEPAGDIHGIADDGVVQPHFRSDIADQHVAGIDADADFDGLAVVVDQTGLL